MHGPVVLVPGTTWPPPPEPPGAIGPAAAWQSKFKDGTSIKDVKGAALLSPRPDEAAARRNRWEHAGGVILWTATRWQQSHM